MLVDSTYRVWVRTRHLIGNMILKLASSSLDQLVAVQ